MQWEFNFVCIGCDTCSVTTIEEYRLDWRIFDCIFCGRRVEKIQ
jgi:hypothetical protein